MEALTTKIQENDRAVKALNIYEINRGWANDLQEIYRMNVA